MARRLPTGISVLDGKLGGGIPAGSVVAIEAPPASQAELLLYELTAARHTLYLTADRTQQAVQDGFDRTTTRTGAVTIRDIPSDTPLDHAQRLFQSLPEGYNLIIDPVDVLERRDRSRYQNFLNELQNHMQNTGNVAVLHCLDGRDVPPLRDATEHMVDIIFDLQVTFKGDSVENRLAVPKFRGGSALAETVKLELTEKVAIDTSRDIA